MYQLYQKKWLIWPAAALNMVFLRAVSQYYSKTLQQKIG
jgi:hypothetical protein